MFNSLHLTMILLWVLVYILFITKTFQKDYSLTLGLIGKAIAFTCLWFNYRDAGFIILLLTAMGSLVLGMTRNSSDDLFKEKIR